MADRFTEILTKHCRDWTQSIEQMQAGKLTMHEDGRDVTQEWIAYLLAKIAEIEEVLDKHEARKNA